MKKVNRSFRFLLAVVLALCSVKMQAQPSTYKEEIDIPGENAWQSTHITTYDGGSMILTSTGNSVSGQSYLTFIKTSATGIILWHKRFGPVVASFENVVQSPDSGYFVCYIDAGVGVSTYEILKLDKNGNVVFTNELQHPGSLSITGIPQVMAKNDGSFYVICDFLDTNNYKSLWHVFQVTATGSIAWSHCYNIHSNKSYHADADTCQNGDLVILGTYFDDVTQLHYPVITRITSTGVPVWTKFYSDGVRHFFSTSIVRMPGDLLVVSGSTTHPVSFLSEIMLMKTDGQGNPLWSFLFTNPAFTPFTTTLEAVENNCTVFVGGSGYDGLIIKTDSSGLMLSKRLYPGVIFGSMDTLPGGLYSFVGYNFSARTILMTTDQSGTGCDDSATVINKTPITMLVTQVMSDTAVGITGVPSAVPQTFATLHIVEVCNSDGIEESSADWLTIFPSPANEFLEVISQKPPGTLEIINLQGQVVRTHTAISEHSSIYVGDLPPGVYFVRTSAGSAVRKIVVAH